MRLAAVLLAALGLTPALGAAQAGQPDLIVEVRLDSHQLSDAIPAYQQGDDIHLPLCELARLLTIAIRCEGLHASGYILDQQRGFHVDAAALRVTQDGATAPLEPSAILRRDGDLYVARGVLARWLPVDLAFDMPNLAVRVTPREKLPLQARLEREAKGRPGARNGGGAGPAYALVDTPYRMFEAPFVDQTVGIDLRPGASSASYTAFASADLLGMEASLYLARASRAGQPATRLTVGRHDPGAGLLGPLRARTALAGSVTAPAIAHIAPGSASGDGVVLSNRPLTQAALLDTHSLRGDLAPGWDVELYYNDGLVGFQQARADGKYSFEDLPLNYGPNDFRLVFHGPLGQVRIERHSYLLEEPPLVPGELVYHLTAQRADAGGRRAVASFDWGLSKRLAANLTLAELRGPGRNRAQRFASVALNGYWKALIASATLVRADDGGRLAQLALKTRVAGMALGASRAVAERYTSGLYPDGPDPVKLRDELRIDGALADVHLAAQARRERRAGGETRELGLRLSAYRFGTAVSHALRWQSGYGGTVAEGIVHASRRMAGAGLSGQLLYGIRPQFGLSALAVSADRRLWPGYLLNLGVTRTFVDPQYRFNAALNKSLGRFGMGIGAFATSRGDVGASLQLFTALGREPRRALWSADAAPMAASGAASVLVFLDRNRNGVMDGADEPVPGAAFTVNGSGHMARTDGGGIAYLNRLGPNQYLDIAIDAASLEDPQWQAATPGMRIVPRAGKVSRLDFAIGITGEIDGTAYLAEQAGKRPIGGVQLELVDQHGALAASCTSSSDGYYVITGVAPGRYALRVSAAQLARLGMEPAPGYPQGHVLTMADDGAFINGKDLVLARVAGTASAAAAAP